MTSIGNPHVMVISWHRHDYPMDMRAVQRDLRIGYIKWTGKYKAITL